MHAPFPPHRGLGRRTLFAIAVAAGAALSVAAPALAFDAASTSAVNVDGAGLALRGHDPVAYFTRGKPTKGSPRFSARHDGVTYHFAAAANRDAFEKEPAKYLPQYGGFCAMGMAGGRKFDGDPTLWRVAEGRLYLNVSRAAQKLWVTDIPGFVRKADANWPQVKDKRPDALQ